MKQKISIIFHSSIFLLTIFVGYLLSRINPVYFCKMGEKIGHEKSVLIIICLLMALIISISYIFITKTDNKIPLRNKKATPLIRLYNKIKYPKYIEYKGFRWKISKISLNKLNILDKPICPNCCVTINTKPNEFDGYYYYCSECDTNFFDYNIPQLHRDLINRIKSDGLKHFKNKIYKTPC